MSQIAISSFSLHTALGPLTIDKRNDDGTLGQMVIDFPRKHDIDDFIRLARTKAGVAAVELCQIQFDSADPERIDRLRAVLDEAGVRLLTLPIDTGDLGHPNDEWRAQDEERIVSWFRIARQLGAQYVRVNAGASGTDVPPETWSRLVGSLRRLGDAANALGLRLLIENHGGASSVPKFVHALLEEVGHDRLGLLLDMGNFEPLVSLSQARFFDPDVQDDGLDLEPLYAAITELAPIATLVHAKSVDPARDGTPLPDLKRALSIVAESGYTGSISIEWEGRLGDPWERTTAMVDEVRARFPHLN
jgi:sugar phosphate isomerase/epimerase